MMVPFMDRMRYHVVLSLRNVRSICVVDERWLNWKSKIVRRLVIDDESGGHLNPLGREDQFCSAGYHQVHFSGLFANDYRAANPFAAIV